MPRIPRKWSFRRWRRRWNDRWAALALRWRIWFDRHILSYEKRRQWHRRRNRRAERIGRAVENAGYKVVPHRPDAAPDTRWTRLVKRLNDFVAERVFPWSFRRRQRRSNDRWAALALRWHIWFDRHILSAEKRRVLRRRWNRRSERIGRAIENAGYRVVPHRPDAVPDTRWTRFVKRLNDFIDERVFPPEARVRLSWEFRRWWHQFTSPFRQANTRVWDWSDDYLLPALTPAGFRKTFFNWKGIAAAIGLVGLVCFAAFWLIPQAALHNERKWAAQARLLLDRGYQSMAYQSAVRALRQNENNEEAGRVIADMLERQGLSEALIWRRKVVEKAGSTTNQLALAATALKFEKPPCPTASRILADIHSPATNSLQFHVVAAQFETKNGNLAAAETHYLAALKAEAANSEVALALALLRLQTRDATKVALAQSSLESLSGQTNMAVRALRPLVALAASRGAFEVALDHSQRILANESSTFEDRLAHLDVLTRKRDPARDSSLTTLQEQVSSNPLYVAQLAGWMTARGQARETLVWFGRLPTAIRWSDAVLLATSDAYVAESDWRGLERFLLERRWGTIEFVRQALLARAYRGLGEPRAFADNLSHATALASGMSVRLGKLTWLVSTWGWDREVDDLLWAVFERFPNEAWASDTLLQRYQERGDTDGIRRVFALQLKRSPNDLPLKNNLAMVLLLLRTDLPTAHRLALEAHQKSPESAVNASTYAFSLCVQGKAAAGRKTMESLGPEMLKVPSIAAYYAIIAAAAGDQAVALKHYDLARQARLLPEERALLEQVHATARPGDRPGVDH